MGDPARALKEVTYLANNLGEFRFVFQELVSDAMNRKRIWMNLAFFRIDIEVQRTPGREVVDQFNPADFNDTVQLGF